MSNRLTELLAGAATGELDAAERRELDELNCRPSDQDAFMRAAALAQLAFMAADREKPAKIPAGLRDRLDAQAATWNRRHSSS
jgi:hypothetical protein